jgi:hypothetical protein
MSDAVDTLLAEETEAEDVTSNNEGEAKSDTAGETPAPTAKVAKATQKEKGKPSQGSTGKATAKAAPAQPAEPPAAEETDGEDDAEEPDVDELIYDNWVGKQPVQVQEMLERQQKALRSALVDERTQRKSLTKQLKTLEVKASTQEVTAEELGKLRATLQEAQRQAHFYESLPGDVSNPRLAFIAAKDMGLITDGGKVNWDGLREQAPQLFVQAKIPVPPANAGTGAKQDGAAKETNMNQIIRNMTGRN